MRRAATRRCGWCFGWDAGDCLGCGKAGTASRHRSRVLSSSPQKMAYTDGETGTTRQLKLLLANMSVFDSFSIVYDGLDCAVHLESAHHSSDFSDERSHDPGSVTSIDYTTAIQVPSSGIFQRLIVMTVKYHDESCLWKMHALYSVQSTDTILQVPQGFSRKGSAAVACSASLRLVLQMWLNSPSHASSSPV